MTRRLLFRLAWLVASLLGAVVLVQALLALAPGDAIDTLPNADEVRTVLAAEWHLDEPLPVQVVTWLGDALTGDLRTSLVHRPGTPVAELVAGPALRSLGTVVAALVLTLAWAAGLAWLTAGRRPWLARPLTAISIVPVFLLAHLVVAGLNAGAWALMERGLLDRPGWFALPLEAHPLRDGLAIVLLAVGSGALAEVHAELEVALGRIRGSGYVEAARARGAPVWPHVLRNLLPELAGVVASRAAFFVGGLVILEKILLLNGLGALLWEAAQARDWPLALGITLVTATAVAAARFAAEAVRLLADPRLRQDGAR